jgi:boron transporter
MHSVLAITNACNALIYVTRSACDIFGFYVACIYFQKGVQVLAAQWDAAGETSAYLSILISLLVLLVGYGLGTAIYSDLVREKLLRITVRH